MNTTGLHYDITDADYHGDNTRLSSTFVRLLTEHVPSKALERKGRAGTKAMNLGKAAHRHWLGTGPELIVWQHNGSTKAGKAERAAYAADIAADVVVAIKPDEFERIIAMAKVLESSPELVEIKASHKAEVTVLWDERGVPCKARVDLLGDSTAYDYKTCTDASLAGFLKAMGTYAYHQQAEWYGRGLAAVGHRAGKQTMQFICQETEPPYLVQIHTPDDVAMATAKDLNDVAVNIYGESTTTGVWRGFDSLRAEPAALPSWYWWRMEQTQEEQEIII